ncbi:hypothetical protein [Sphingobacterium anhuiense]|uniref:hypothetical protein n=1 Tax=Sphingobacterium anhuiense TaxID=493780 RepID=UPI003C2B511C
MSKSEYLIEIYGYENVSQIEQREIYRCVKKNEEQIPYEINYIDFSDDWINCNIEQYLETVLNSDFYSSQGFLQWNFYYYFISTDSKINDNKKKIKEIEINQDFARKSVLNFTAFKKLQLSWNAIGTFSTKDIERDLYSTWIDILKQNDLHFVYADNVRSYKKSTEDYLDGTQSFTAENDIYINEDSTIKSLKRIDKLNLETYRKYPIIKSFTLGKVVLAHGPNATGKTSFLDSIELIITGKCSRQKNLPSYQINLTDDKGNLYSYPEKSSNVYKERDSKWFKNYTTRGNNLNGNFNRFNYFTSDAAYELKKKEDNQDLDLEKVIADIALGQEVNRLEEKILGFRKRFGDINDSLQSDLLKLTKDNQLRQTEIEALKRDNTNTIDYKNRFSQELKNRKWKEFNNDNESEYIHQTSAQIQIVEECLGKLKNPLNSLKEVTRANVLAQFIKVSNLQNELKIAKEKIHKLKHEQITQHSESNKIQNKSLILQGLARYFSHPHIDSLFGLDEKISEIDRKINNEQNINSLFLSLPLTEQFITFYDEKTIPEIGNEIEIKQNLVLAAQLKTQHDIQELEDGIGRLNQILTDIKSSGQEFIKLNTDATNCPLCGTNFEKDKLILAIEETKHQLSSTQILQNLKEDREKMKTEISLIEFEKEITQRLIELSLFQPNYRNIPLKSVIEDLESKSKLISDLTYQKIELETILMRFNLENLNEQEFDKLLTEWSTYSKMKMTKEDFYRINLEESKHFQKTREIDETTSEIIKRTEYKILNLYTPTLPNDRTIANELFYLEEAINNFSILELHILIPDNKGIHEYLIDLSYVIASFSHYEKAFKEDKAILSSITAFQKIIEDNLDKIYTIKSVKDKAQFAFTILDELLIKHNKNEYLKDYLSKNRKEIVEIFKLIHSPKEFNDIELEGDRILLISGDEKRTLDQISTGQRAALALSIFLTLNNKLRNGPGIILLDDPITYVDDLNILSFLDYLRKLVLNSNKQIIFATANNDLAFLFKMKFGFLNRENFTEFKFTREEY